MKEKYKQSYQTNRIGGLKNTPIKQKVLQDFCIEESQISRVELEVFGLEYQLP